MGFIIITGGMGLLGQSVLRSVLSSRSCISKQYTRVILVDTDNVFPPEVGDARGVDTSQHGSQSTSVSTLRRDVGSPEFAAELRQLIMENGAYFPLTIFHLASVMSAQGEEDFERALHVNVDGTRLLLETCRHAQLKPRFVFASSIAAFGGGADITDSSKHLPRTTYGMTKACAELLVNECTRKGFVDGRIARLPTVIVRPGPPNPAATGCFSSVPKAVLNSHEFISPVSPDLQHPCIGLASVVRGLIHLHDVPEKRLGNDRAVTLPSISLTLRDLEESATKLALELGRSPGKITYERNAITEGVVRAMPSAVQISQRALDLGLLPDSGVDQIIREYVQNQQLL